MLDSRLTHLRALASEVLEDAEEMLTEHSGFSSCQGTHAVLIGEIDEYWDEYRHENYDKARLAVRLRRIAAMAIRGANDLEFPT